MLITITDASLTASIHLNMTQTGVKAPKPFLKRGTRKYLSNATVRSGNQKPKVVDFGNEEGWNELAQHPKRNGPVQDFAVDIKVSSRPKPKAEERGSGQKIKSKENKQMNEDISVRRSSGKVEQRQSSVKKKTAIDDYLPVQIKNTAKPPTKAHFAPPVPPQSRTTIGAGKMGTLTTMLSGQQQEQDHSSSEEGVEQEMKATAPSFHRKQEISKSPNAVKAKPKTTPVQVHYEEDGENVRILSDEEDNPSTQIFSKGLKSRAKPQNKPKQKIVQKVGNKWSDDENERKSQKEEEEEQYPDKVLKKYYGKEEKPKHKQRQGIPAHQSLSIKDIPQSMKEAIFNQMLQQTSSEINQKLVQLKLSISEGAKEKQKWQEENKKLMKEREAFQREMVARKKEFDEEKKMENNKIGREKMYLKEKQTSGKADYQLRAELEEVRKRVGELEAEKKRLRSQKDREIERLKRNLQEIGQENRDLKDQMKYIQRERLEVKDKMKNVEKKGQVQLVQDHNLQTQPRISKASLWADCPTSSYISCMLEDNFSLMDLCPQQYNFDQLEYYKYYMQVQSREDRLISEQQEPNTNKITRLYESGKKEVELVAMTLKETFPAPFKFSVVTHANQDYKLILPQGISIYFSSRSQTSQFTVTPTKKIYYFHNQHTIQMKFEHPRKGTVEEAYFTEKGQMRREQKRSGRVQLWQQKGGTWSMLQ